MRLIFVVFVFSYFVASPDFLVNILYICLAISIVWLLISLLSQKFCSFVAGSFSGTNDEDDDDKDNDEEDDNTDAADGGWWWYCMCCSNW